MSISATIKSVQDIMRQDAGVDGDAQRISQLVWMLFLKVFDSKEKEWDALSDNYTYIIPDGLRWSDWAENDEGITGDELLEFVNNTLFKTFKDWQLTEKSDTKTLLVKSLFEDSYNYMKSGTLMRSVINKLNAIDFNRASDRHLFNDIYENILKDLQSAGNSGEYYTPRAVTQFMVDMINPKLGEQVLDFACGTGGFLVCALEHLRKQVQNIDDEAKLQAAVLGVEKKPLPHMLCTMNMILHNIDNPQIRHDNSLIYPVKNIKAKDKVDIIITNPPFGGIEEDGIQDNFPTQFKTKETADLFLVLLMYKLNQTGRAAIVLPDGFLFGEGTKTAIKEKLLNEFNLHTIVRLPNGVTVTNIKASDDLGNYTVLGGNHFAYNPYRINVGSIGLINQNLYGVVSPAYVVFETTKEISSEFLLYYLKSELGINLIKWYGDRGGVRSSLRFADLKEIDFPNIELEEQKLVMEKVKQIDNKLSQFNANLSLEQISSLRQAILQQAVEGKLCKQDPADEPASVLLEKIKAEKEKLIAEKKIKCKKSYQLLRKKKSPLHCHKGGNGVGLQMSFK